MNDVATNDLYRELILDHYKHPRNVGVLTDGIIQEEINPLCGDTTTLSLRVAGGVIIDINHQTHGCALCTASMSLLTEHVKGMTLDAARKLNADDVFAWIGTTPGTARLKCVLLPLATLNHALHKVTV